MAINTYNDLFPSLRYKCLYFIYLLVCLLTGRLSYELEKSFLVQETSLVEEFQILVVQM